MSRMFTYNGKRMSTWNLFTGCGFNCYNGGCWARKLAEGRLKKFYPQGFIPTTHPDRFVRHFKPGEFVFPVSMGDIAFAPFEILDTIIKTAVKHPKTKFILCTKDPARYRQLSVIPDNVYLGTTIETTEDFAVSYAPNSLMRYDSLLRLSHPHKFLSIEPIMDFDLKRLVWWVEQLKPEIIEVGADNWHCSLQEPPPEKLNKLLAGLRQLCPNVIEKEGLERLKRT